MSEHTHGEYEVSDGQKRYYTPTTEDIQRAYTSYTQPSMSDSGELFYGTAVEFDRWLFHLQEDAWDAGYVAGLSDGWADTPDATENPHQQEELE